MQSTAEAAEGTPVGLVLGATSFYAESGGQTADTGAVASASGASFQVEVRWGVPEPGWPAAVGSSAIGP